METKRASTDPLSGKVAQVLNDRELVINIGRNQGVTSGMKFAVLAEAPIEIHDPDTHGLIGIIDRPKVKVVAKSIEENFTICSTYEVRVVGNSLFDIMQPRREIPETLSADDNSRPKPLSLDESYVKIGDVVRQIGD